MGRSPELLLQNICAINYLLSIFGFIFLQNKVQTNKKWGDNVQLNAKLHAKFEALWCGKTLTPKKLN